MGIQKLSLAYEYDFLLLGIISSSKDFSLAWHINLELGLSLEKEKDLELMFLKDCKIFISSYIFETETSKFRLLKNKSVDFLNTKHPYLIPELKKYDYFILFYGEFALNATTYLEKLKTTSAIQLVKIIEINPLTSKENLLI